MKILPKITNLECLNIFFLVFFSSFYLAKLTQLSPVYLISIFSLFILTCCMLARGRLSFPLPSVFLFLFLLYSQFIQLTYFNNLSTYINLCLGILSFIFIVGVRYRYDFNFWVFSSKMYIYGVIFFCGIDSIYRLLNPQAPSKESLEVLQNSSDIGFYLFKFGSLAFADSNTTALVCLTSAMLSYYLWKFQNVNVSFLFYLTVLIMLSCLSRSAAISFFLIILFYSFNYYLRLILIFVLLMSLFFIFSFIGFDISDGSLDSKLYIIYKFFDYFSSVSLVTMFFGVGFDGSTQALNIYGHIFLITLIVECGLVGLFLYSAFIISILFETRFKIAIILMPMAISSLSYFFYLGAPFFFVAIALLYNLHCVKKS